MWCFLLVVPSLNSPMENIASPALFEGCKFFLEGLFMNKNDVPDLNHLFEQFKAGKMPNVLEVIAAISDISTLYPEYDSEPCALADVQNREFAGYLCPPDDNRCPNCNL